MSDYQHFCAMGRWVDTKLAALGAERICAVGLGDDDDDLDGDFEAWREVLWAALCPGSTLEAGAKSPAPFRLAAAAAQFKAEWLREGTAAPSNLDFLARTQPKHPLYELPVAVYTQPFLLLQYLLSCAATLRGRSWTPITDYASRRKMARRQDTVRCLV